MTTNDLSAAAERAQAHLAYAHEAELENRTSDYEQALSAIEETRAALYSAIIDAREVFTVREIAEQTGLSSARIAQITKEDRR